MLTLAVILALSGLVTLLTKYGTVARNRWGINRASVSCPNCNTPRATGRKPRSLSQIVWGGYTCPACGADVDKWGRQVASPDKLKGDSRNFWTKKRNIGFDRLRDAPAGFW